MHARQHIIVFLCFTAALRASAQIQNQGWWNHSVFYQIYPRSFMDSGEDGIGDLEGITSKLEHFVDIGVTGIWLSPINQSPMKDFGYDISDFRDIQEEYGTIKDFDELVKRAKELGLKVILDLVPNHTSDNHEWFQKSIKKVGRYTDFYIWADPVNETDTKTPPNNWLSVFGGSAWTYNKERKQWYFHQFLPEQPDLNYRNPEVENEMEQIIEYWLKKGVDGFRIDAVPHLFETSNITLDEPPSNVTNINNTEYASLNHIYTKDQKETYFQIQKWRNVVDLYAHINNESEKVLMTEAYTTLQNTLKFYESGSHIPFNFKFIIDANSKSTAADFKKIMDAWISGMPQNGIPNWVMGNHDRKRLATRYPGRADQMTMLAMILPGVAITYYGEEIGMEDNNEITYEETKDTQACKDEENFDKISRDPCRTPFQWNGNETLNAGFSNSTNGTWLPIHRNFNTLNLKKQKDESGVTHYSVYKSLTHLRKSLLLLKSGSYESYVRNNDNLLVVKRSNDFELVTLIINFSDNKNQEFALSNITDRELLKTEIKVASVNSGVKVNTEVKNHVVSVPAKASIVTFTTYKPENNGVSKEHGDSLLVMILLSITVMALRS